MSQLALPVLGIPVRFDAATPRIADAVEAHFGVWRGLEDYPELLNGPRTPEPTVRLVATPPERGARAPGAGDPFGVRTGPGGRLRLALPGPITGDAWLDRAHARLRIGPDALHDPRLIGEALDTVTLFLLTRRDREPVHAAAIAAGANVGLVLAGPSGVGKSTLALAAMRAGLRVLTDEAVYVQLRPGLRVWGMGRPLHVTPDTARRFPELADREAVTRAGGTPKVPVDLMPGGVGFMTPPVLERVGLCVLDAARPGPPVERLPVEVAVRELTTRLDPGFDAFRETIPERLRALARGGAWRVRVDARPEESLPVLMEILATGGG